MSRAKVVNRRGGSRRVVIELTWYEAEVLVEALDNHGGEYQVGSFIERACDRVASELRRVGVRPWGEHYG